MINFLYLEERQEALQLFVGPTQVIIVSVRLKEENLKLFSLDFSTMVQNRNILFF